MYNQITNDYLKMKVKQISNNSKKINSSISNIDNVYNIISSNNKQEIKKLNDIIGGQLQPATQPATKPATPPTTSPVTQPQQTFAQAASKPATPPTTPPVTQPQQTFAQAASKPATSPTTPPVTQPVITTTTIIDDIINRSEQNKQKINKLRESIAEISLNLGSLKTLNIDQLKKTFADSLVVNESSETTKLKNSLLSKIAEMTFIDGYTNKMNEVKGILDEIKTLTNAK